MRKTEIEETTMTDINKIENGKFSKSTNENILKFRDFLFYETSRLLYISMKNEYYIFIDIINYALRKKGDCYEDRKS